MSNFADLFNLYRFPNGRRAYALEGVVRAAHELGHTDLEAAAREAFEWEKETTTLLRNWTREKNTIEGVREEAVALDKKLDRAVSAVASQLEALSSTFEGEPQGKLAQQVMARLMPAGVAGIVLLSYEEQLAQCRDLVAGFRALPEADFAQLNIETFVARIEELIPLFKAALDGASKRELSYADVKTRDAQGQERMLSVVARCLAAYPGISPQDQQGRARLLAPILDQQRRLKESYRSRQGQTDVNPETGEELVPTAVSQGPAVSAAE